VLTCCPPNQTAIELAIFQESPISVKLGLTRLETEHALEYRPFNAERFGPNPPLAEAAEYEQVLRELCDDAGRLSAQVDLYDFGHVSCAGISDIDVLFVVPDISSPALCRELVALCRGQPHFFHGPMIASCRVASEFGFIFPGIELRHLAGPGRLKVLETPGDRLPDVAWSDLLDGALARWLWLDSMASMSVVDPRHLMLGLWALRRLALYQDRIALEIGGDTMQFCREVHDQRERWNAVGELDRETLAEQANQAFGQCQSILEHAARFAEDRDGISAIELPGGLYGGKTSLVCSKSAEFRIDRFKLSMGLRRRTYNRVGVPPIVFRQICRLNSHASDRAGLAEATQRRVNALRDYRRFVEEHMLDGAAVPPGIFSRRSTPAVMAVPDRIMASILTKHRWVVKAAISTRLGR
jgi:hypothetical protein